MKRHWTELAYALLVAMYPKSFRDQHGDDMRLVFSDLLHDPQVRKLDLVRRVLGDMRYLNGGGLLLSIVFGSLVVLIWLANRSIDIGARDPGTIVPLALIALLFVAVGFTGSRRSGRFTGGIRMGFTAGVVSALTVPGEYLLFHSFPFYEVKGFVLTYAIAAAIVMFFVSTGAMLADLRGHQARIGRAFRAFVGAWRQDSELSA